MKKLWNNLPITKKLMAITIMFFLLFCVVIFFGQMAFFESYYTHIKLNEVRRIADEISRDYTEDNDYKTKIAELSDEYGCYVMLLGGDGSIKYALSYYMELEKEDESVIRFTLDNAIRDNSFENLNLAVGDSVEVVYISGGDFEPSHSFFPTSVRCSGKIWSAPRRGHKEPPHMPEWDGERKETTVRGTITSIVLPNGQNRNINAERYAASRAAIDWISGRVEDMTVKGGSTSYYYIDEESGDRYCVVVKDTADGNIVFTIAPLNMVSEAADVAMHVYTLLFLFTMIGACVIGIIFARAVTKPILELTDITKCMAGLDFSRRCEYSANDEVGELAGNINILSDALDSTITELQAANEQLQADIEHERAIEKSRREFVAAASHELKTPLGIIRAYTEALIDGVSENKRSRYMQVIVDETGRMDRLILDMLDNAKLESGAQKPVMMMHDISGMMKNLSARFSEVISRKNISLALDLPPHKVIRSFDGDMIERVITNFIANAVNNTPDNGAICCRVNELSDGIVEVGVENSGSHIDDDDYEHIWDRFYKADKSRRRSAGGTGLGLSIAKNILIMHNAEYGVENMPDGVRFYFKIR